MEKEEADESKEKEKEKTGVKAMNTPKISEAFHKMTKIDPHGQKQARYDKKLLELLASYFLSLTPHLSLQQMGSLGFGPRLGSGTWV